MKVFIEGIQQGLTKAHRQYILNMKARHYANSEIAAIVGLTEAEIERLLNEESFSD